METSLATSRAAFGEDQLSLLPTELSQPFKAAVNVPRLQQDPIQHLNASKEI